jgi:hypothetical protein
MLLPAIALALSLAQPGSATFDPGRIEQARANYEAIMRGRKHIRDLTPRERRELLAIAEAIEDGKAKGTRSERCVAEERERLGTAPSELDQRVIDMKCREPGGPLN